jgi:hypothetical protein
MVAPQQSGDRLTVGRMSAHDRPADDDILSYLKDVGCVPANPHCEWMVKSRVVSWNAKEHPRALRCHVYAWPNSSERDMEPLAGALAGLPGAIATRPLTEGERDHDALRWGAIVFRPTWQYEDFRARGALGQPW